MLPTRLKKWIQRNYGTRSPKFNPEDKYEDIASIPFAEAVERVEWCIDSPVMYSNEPTKDLQSWERVFVSACIGNHVIELRKKGPEALREWTEWLIAEDLKVRSK